MRRTLAAALHASNVCEGVCVCVRVLCLLSLLLIACLLMQQHAASVLRQEPLPVARCHLPFAPAVQTKSA